MNDEKNVDREEAQITGRTEGPFGSDDTDADVKLSDNRNQAELENSANGLDSTQVRGGQDGRNNRGMGSTDMDSQNGVLRMGDMDTSTMEVTDEALNSAAASESATNTAMVDVTTESSDRAVPDDYASAGQVAVPNAQKAAKAQNDPTDEADEDVTEEDKSQQDRENEVAETGTDLTNQPTY